MDLLKSIRALALHSVSKKDSDYIYRHVCRWYSKEFATPIAEVEELPLEELLQHYFEVRYENMDEDDFKEERTLVCETDEERTAREKAESEEKESDEAFFRMQQALVDQAKTLPGNKMAPEDNPFPVPKDQKLREFTPEEIKQLPPDIKLEFISEEELDTMEAWDLLGPAKKDK